MKPIFTGPTCRMANGGKIRLPVARLITLAARNGKSAPSYGEPSAQPSIGWQPPRLRRRSSAGPSSNSWLPTAATSSPIAFIASIAGSSWKSEESSGLPPTRSPAATTNVWRARSRSVRMWVARYSAPPAGKRSSSRRMIVPGVVDSRWPWKSLIPSSWTRTGSGGLRGLPRFCAAAGATAIRKAANAAAVSTAIRCIDSRS